MNFLCVTDLMERLQSDFPQADLPPDWEIVPEPCPPEMNGELTVNCFRFAKFFRCNPMQLAEKVCGILSAHADVESAESIKAFVNVTLRPSAIFRDTAARSAEIMDAAFLPEPERRRILIEYSAPNTNKPQHLGHVRNNILGMSLVSLLKRVGHEVIPVNLVNDRGIHICKSMLAYQRFGDGVTPESSGRKGDHLVGDFYVRYDQELRRQLEELRDGSPELAEKSDDDLFLETEIGAAAQAMLQAWEAGDPEIRALWEKMNSWVFAGFAETYRRMGVEFERTYLESETYLLGKEYIAKGLVDGIFARREDGAVYIDLGKKLGQKVVLRSDGTSVYITQDIGTTMLKYDDYCPDIQIWIVGDEQLLHFKLLFAILKALGMDWAERLKHLSYGMVNLPSGKMKSREGTVVDADDLFDEMHRLARTATLERCGDDVPEDIEERSEIIAMGALKFMLLKFNPRSSIMFDPQASIRFEGDTGPYVQYACARINSIERKSLARGLSPADSEIRWDMLGHESEKGLSFELWQYPQVLRQAAERMDCSGLVAYLLDLAKSYSRFYRDCPILNADDLELCRARLALSYAVRDILMDGLSTLTVRAPEFM